MRQPHDLSFNEPLIMIRKQVLPSHHSLVSMRHKMRKITYVAVIILPGIPVVYIARVYRYTHILNMNDIHVQHVILFNIGQ